MYVYSQIAQCNSMLAYLWSLICGIQDLTETLLLIWTWSDLAYLFAFIFAYVYLHVLVLHWTNLISVLVPSGMVHLNHWIELNRSVTLTQLLCNSVAKMCPRERLQPRTTAWPVWPVSYGRTQPQAFQVPAPLTAHRSRTISVTLWRYTLVFAKCVALWTIAGLSRDSLSKWPHEPRLCSF